MMLYEKYRPKRFEDVIGQDKAVGKVKAVLSKQWGGRAWWIAGPSGTGKSTLATLIANVGCECVREMVGGEVTLGMLDEIREEIGKRSLFAPTPNGKTPRAYIVNEAHGMRRAVIQRLDDMLERKNLPEHIVWVFTTSREGQKQLFDGQQVDAPMFLSRCLKVNLSSYGLAQAFAARAKEIAMAEGLDGKALPAYTRLINEKHGNLRDVLDAIEMQEMMA